TGPEAVAEDLPALPHLAEERVVRRNGSVQVEAKDLPLELVQVLGVGVGRRAWPTLVVAQAGVADARVELRIGAHAEDAAVVVAVVRPHAGEEDRERTQADGVARPHRHAHDLTHPPAAAARWRRTLVRPVEV